jgi:hypothetical protein
MAPSKTDCIYDLAFRGAETNTVHLRLCLRAEGGRFAAGVTVGPLGPTAVDCAGLALDGNSVTGAIKTTIGFDGFFPKDGKPIAHEYRIRATVAGDKLAGVYEGAVVPGGSASGVVEGALSPAPDRGGYGVMDLQLENGAGTNTLRSKSWGERVYPKLFLKDGRFAQNLIYGWGGRVQINYFESAVVSNGLRFDGKTLSGPLAVRTTAGSLYVFTLDGTVVGAQIGGTFRKEVDGLEAVGGPFHGKLTPMPERSPAQALHYLELHDAVGRTWIEGSSNTLQLMVSAPCMEGRFGQGVAYAAAWNHVFHDVDASGLKLDADRLSGELKVTMNPDPYMPPDKKPVAAVYTVDAKIADGRIVVGAFAGTFGDRKVSGPVFGELMDQPRVPEPVAINVKLEDGVNNGAPWHRRTWLNFVAIKGVASAGGMSNNKNGWTGEFKRAKVKFDGAAFTAEIDGAVNESKGVELGAYTFKLTGRVVGSELVGTCDTYRDGKPTKTGTPFMGGFGAVRAGAGQP